MFQEETMESDEDNLLFRDKGYEIIKSVYSTRVDEYK